MSGGSTSQYNGATKYVTTDCAGCHFRLTGKAAERMLALFTFPKKHRAAAKRERQFCVWGVAVKTLVEHDKAPRHCALPDQPAPGATYWVEFLNTPLPDQPALFASEEPS